MCYSGNERKGQELSHLLPSKRTYSAITIEQGLGNKNQTEAKPEETTYKWGKTEVVS